MSRGASKRGALGLTGGGLLQGSAGGLLIGPAGGASPYSRRDCCCGEPPPPCAYYRRATLCPAPPTCVNATPEVYLRCDARCDNGAAIPEQGVVRVGPFGICYRAQPGRYSPDPEPGELPLPASAWLVRETALPCVPSCSGCAPLDVWYRVALCACDPRGGSSPPLVLDCALYHELVDRVRALEDPFACVAFAGQWGGGSVCFVLEGGAVLASRPPGSEIPLASLVLGGCCACAGCWPTCEAPAVLHVRQESAGGGLCQRDERTLKPCCCNSTTAVSTASSVRRFFDPPSAGGRLNLTETVTATLDAAGLTVRTRLEFHLTGQVSDEQITTPAGRCERDRVYVSAAWRPELCQQDAVGSLRRDCAGGSASYNVYGLDGSARYLAVEVSGQATHAGELGPCTGCQQGLDGPAGGGGGGAGGGGGGGGAGGGGGGETITSAGPCAGCGGGVGVGASPEQIERFLRGE